MVLVTIPQSIAIKVSNKYVNLRRQMMRSRERRPYPISKLHENIRNALSIAGDYIDPRKLQEPIYKAWVDNKYKSTSSFPLVLCGSIIGKLSR